MYAAAFLYFENLPIMNDKTITQPNLKEQKELNDLVENEPTYVPLGKWKIPVRWIRRGTLRKVSKVIHSKKKEDEIASRCAALLVLNGWWKIKLFYPLLWRYIFMAYTDEELVSVIVACKKKEELQTQQYLLLTMLLIEMKDTMMSMNREEAERIRQGLSTVQDLQAGKNIQN